MSRYYVEGTFEGYIEADSVDEAEDNFHETGFALSEYLRFIVSRFSETRLFSLISKATDWSGFCRKGTV